MSPLALSLVLAAGVNSCIGNLCLKWSRSGEAASAGMVSQLTHPLFLLGLAFYGINVVLFAKALETAPVSSAYPVLAGSGFALLTLASAFLFKEAVTIDKLAGLGLILVGIWFLARPGAA